jgi:hypothetical protein
MEQFVATGLQARIGGRDRSVHVDQAAALTAHSSRSLIIITFELVFL